jgi:hypothetical protein
MIRESEPRTDVLDIVGHRLHRPPEHRQHVAASGRLPTLGHAVADVQRPVPPELRGSRIAAPVHDVELRRLGAAQPPAIHHLEQRRVSISRQRALALRADRAVDLVIGVVQKPLQLIAGQRTLVRVSLVGLKMRDRVPLVHDRHRMLTRPELLLARHRPAISAVTEKLGEDPQSPLVSANRRRSQMPLSGQRQRPLIHMRRRPPPRVLVGELHELAHQPLPLGGRLLPQAPRSLLRPPTPQHRLAHRVLRAQPDHARHQLQVCRTRQVDPPQPILQTPG